MTQQCKIQPSGIVHLSGSKSEAHMCLGPRQPSRNTHLPRMWHGAVFAMSVPSSLLYPPSVIISPFSAALIGWAFLRASLNKLDSLLGSSRKWNSICETTQLDSKIFPSSQRDSCCLSLSDADIGLWRASLFCTFFSPKAFFSVKNILHKFPTYPYLYLFMKTLYIFVWQHHAGSSNMEQRNIFIAQYVYHSTGYN